MELNREAVLQSFLKHEKALAARNAKGIEKHRKGDFVLHFSSDGAKKVTVKQKKHSFLFGCNAFMLNSFEEAEKEGVYKQKFAALFNQAVVPFYWSDLEPREGELRFHRDSENIYRRPAPDIVLDFCREYGIEPKGHCLVWNNSLPDWLGAYSPDERKQIVERRFAEIAREYADKIPSFDIVNESATNYNRGRKKLFEGYDEHGLLLGGRYFPQNRKILNETNGAIWQNFAAQGKYMAFRMQLEEFLKKGLPIDEIGLQYHIFERAEALASPRVQSTFLDVENMLDILDLLGAYALPMHISEITVPSYMDSGEVNEALQAEATELLYRTWFATEHMKSIVWWNLVDGYAAYAPIGTNQGENYYGGGLLRFDMSEKPVYRVLDRLINREWRTDFAQRLAGNALAFRGFYGEYEVTVEDESGCRVINVSLNENGKEVKV